MTRAMTSMGLALVAALVVAACASERATPADCTVIFDRIVALELAEMGYRDPALAERKRAELARRLAPELARCEGRRIGEGARACVAAATSAEELVHRCLR